MKKLLGILMAAVMVVSLASAFAASEIMVVSREEGSGTRGAFIELTGIETDAGDMTYAEAIVQSGTSAVMTTVESAKDAIGYISLGSLNETVKAVTVEGVEATVENILNSTYVLARPFNIAIKGDASELEADFITWLFSEEAQAIVAGSYVPVQTAEYAAADVSGTIVVGGSTSVTPLMEKLAEAYMAMNKNVVIEVQGVGSSAGMTGAIEGTFDIGMASRELKDSEKAELNSLVLAMDGIAVIVNNESTVENLTIEQIRQIFTGEVTDWENVK